MPTPSLAAQMVPQLEAALKKNVRAGSVSVDGTTVNFTSRDQLMKEYTFWKNQLAREGGRRMFRTFNLGSTMPDSGGA